MNKISTSRLHRRSDCRQWRASYNCTVCVCSLQSVSAPVCTDSSWRAVCLAVPITLALFGGVGSTVACESALRSAGTLLSQVRAPLPAPDLQGPFCRRFEPRYRRPGLTEGLKA
ncbi:hypothetical protein PoB_004193500 [Plakobranchus ocellatus]|uniref:Uncharacterized protein n=1 Tax=Plakobranchus ocellatus TaxID=259542 RepID=A0AAV4B4B0_9GAST|nr:hypothetical protein PoB_004193500 [Plakobranchus ocellatus]